MSASSRSMNLSALSIAAVLLLIAQVQCQGVCPGANPVKPPAQTTASICSGQKVVAYIVGPTNTIYPADGVGTPSGQARCTGTTTIQQLTIDVAPSFSLGANPYCGKANGTCAAVA